MRWLLVLLLASPALADDPAGRRAVRGRPIGAESESLAALRKLEEEILPAPVPGGRNVDDPLVGFGGDETKPLPWLARLKMPDLPVRLEARVLRYLELYKDDRRGRAIYASWLRAEGRFAPLISTALAKAGLPAALIHVAMIESGFDPHDRSHKGAVGLWQLLPENARIYGLRVDFWVDERKDPVKATAAATRYLGDLYERFGGWPLALAAFNCGYGAVTRAMQKYNTNDYWELTRHEDGLPWDTVLYVPKVLATAIVAENREFFGYSDVRPDPPFAFERVRVTAPTSLAAAARAVGVPAAELEALNPELRRKRVPPDPSGAGWELRVPPGSAERLYAALHNNGGLENVRPYVVRFGERIEEIAQAHGLSARELKSLNAIDDTSDVRAGVTLVVPLEGRPLPPSGCETTIVAVPDKDAAVPGRRRVFYRALPGDQVADIAAFFKVRAADLSRWNNLDADAKLAASQVVQIWIPEDFDTSQAALLAPSSVRVTTVGSDEFFDLVERQRGRVRQRHEVKAGETLERIGKHYGLTVADLERINRFGAHKTKLAVGQKLVVYRAMTPAEKKNVCAVAPGGTEVNASWPPSEDPGVLP